MVRFVLLVTGVAITGAAQAALLDNMDSTVNFGAPFGGVTATARGDGTVVLSRTVASTDAGITWSNGGGLFSLSTDPVLTVTPSAPVNGGYYSAQILFFDSGGGFVSENSWITDTNSIAAQSVDLSSWASTPASAAQYQLHLRVLPWNTDNGAFAFDQISAVPEPAALAGLALSSLCLLRRRRA